MFRKMKNWLKRNADNILSNLIVGLFLVLCF